MKMNTRHIAVVGTAICTALLISYAAADPGHGHAYGHSQTGTSQGSSSGVGSSGPQLFLGDGTAAPTYKNGSDFFTTATAGKSHGHETDFLVPPNSQTGTQKNDSSQFVSATGAGSSTSTTSKTSSAIDAAKQQPEWLINATSSRHDTNPKSSETSAGKNPPPSPTQSVIPAATQSSSPAPAGTPYPIDIPAVFPTGTREGHIMPPGQPPPVPQLTPSQPAINPPPDI